MPVYKEEERELWEELLLKEVERTVKEVWTTAGKPKQVFLAVDGVVPMAKIRQQRVRRFKSAYSGKSKASASWDTNAITPGTEFMNKLGIMLKKINSNWLVSGVDECGEGEHKIMQWLRGRNQKGPVVVYGLDADLILLSMLTGESCGIDVYLLREKQEFGKNQGQGQGQGQVQEYQYLNIRELQLRVGLSGQHAVLNYIGYMNLMGNDFLPHSLTHKLSEDGHDFILQCIKSGEELVDSSGKLSLTVLKGVFERWSQGEEQRMLYMIQKKRLQAERGVGKGMAEEEGLPLEWNVEKAFLEKDVLKESWKHEYWMFLHSSYDIEHVCKEYLKGCQWILDYYTGKPVNRLWMFPAWLPPLWSDLAKYLSENTVDCSQIVTDSPTPEEQLAMVLPLESWHLIKNPVLRRLPALIPQMWPRSFGFVSVGRKWFWECEARIPVLTLERVRSLI
jgi:5'-3' exonuclease